jgi:hypothetical protein
MGKTKITTEKEEVKKEGEQVKTSKLQRRK